MQAIFQKIRLICFAFLVSATLAHAEPEIHHFFPQHRVLLGQPLFWVIRLRYPLWESYSLKINPCAGAKIEVVEHHLNDDAGEMASVYRLKIVPEELNLPDVPSVTFLDNKGQGIVLNGKPLIVTRISGASLAVQDPTTPQFLGERRSITPWLLVLPLLAMALVMIRFRAATPRAVFIRGLKRALDEIRKGHLPFSVWKLLRSEFLWGFPAETQTGSQLEKAAGSDPRFLIIAQTIQAMEQIRYSGKKQVHPVAGFERPVLAALEIVKGRRK